jgi:hypothetical protein
MFDEIPVYTLGNELPVETIKISRPVTSQPIPIFSGMIIGTGILNSIPDPEPVLDEQQIKERHSNMGNKVLRHVNAHETAELGKLSETIRERIQYIKDSAMFNNTQWKAFAELTQAINDMIGDPYDPRSVEPD